MKGKIQMPPKRNIKIKVMPSNKKKEKEFEAKLLNFLISTTQLDSKNEFRKYKGFLSKVSIVEARYYILLYENVKAIRAILLRYEDEKFQRLNKSEFYQMVINLSQIPGLFYSRIRSLETIPYANKYSCEAMEEHIQWRYLWAIGEFEPLENSPGSKNRYFKLENSFMKKGFEKNACFNLKKALTQLDEYSSTYESNFIGFLKANELMAFQKYLREMNWAFHCLTGYFSRWCTLYQYFTEDRRY